jgi:hypothetical protein
MDLLSVESQFVPLNSVRWGVVPAKRRGAPQGPRALHRRKFELALERAPTSLRRLADLRPFQIQIGKLTECALRFDLFL